MIIEGRTITTVAELREFCDAAVAAAHADPASIRLRTPYDMRVNEIERADGSKVCELLISSAARGGPKL
jgi:hypothetical protein